MGAKKAPAAPPSPVSSQQLGQAWGSANQNIDAAASNPYPKQAYDIFAPQLANATPYGYDPSQMVNYANQWAAQGPQMFDWANQVMQTGFDPQNALYNRASTNTANAMRSAQGARGIQMSSHGAGLEGQGMANFNIDWENQQLQRQALASQAAAQLFGQGGQAIQGGAQLGQQIPTNVATYAGALQQLGMGAYAPEMWAAQQYGNLFGTGAGAQSQAYQNQLKQHEVNQAASSSMWGGIGKLAGSLGSAAIMASDRRLKKDIQKIGDHPEGFGIYTFRYKDPELESLGVCKGYMADEVELVRPDAVLTDPLTGMKAINYSLLV